MAKIEIDIDDEHARRVAKLAESMGVELNEFMSLSWAVMATLWETQHSINGATLREYIAREDRTEHVTP